MEWVNGSVRLLVVEWGVAVYKYFYLLALCGSLTTISSAEVDNTDTIEFDDITDLNPEQIQLLLNMSKKFKVLLQREQELRVREGEVRETLRKAEALDAQTRARLKQIEKFRTQVLGAIDAIEYKQAEVYKKMPTDQAVKCLTCMDVTTVCRMLRLMPTKTQAAIMSRMPRLWKRKIQEEWGQARRAIEQA